jgi:hypothetical protein
VAGTVVGGFVGLYYADRFQNYVKVPNFS